MMEFIEDDNSNTVQIATLSFINMVDPRPVKLRWYYQMGRMPVLQYGYIVSNSIDGSHIEWADVPVEYEPGYIKGL